MVHRYAHFVDEMRREAAAQMAAILKPIDVKPAEVKVD
jgi:hypothetical protein